MRDCDDTSANKENLEFGAWIEAPTVGGRKSVSTRAQDGSERTSSSSQATYKPFQSSPRTMAYTGPKGFSEHLIRNSKANENIESLSNEGNSQLAGRDHIATRNVSSPNDHTCLTSTELMVCMESKSPIDDIPLVSLSEQSSKTKWKCLARTKKKAPSMNMQVIGNKRPIELIDDNSPDHGIGKKLARKMRSSYIPTAKVALQPR